MATACPSASFSGSARIPFSSRRSAAISRPRPFRRQRPTLMACAADTNIALLEAAKHAVDRYVRNGMVIGLGSGCASCLAIQYLGGRLRDGALQDIIGIPMSVSSATEAAKAGIPLELCRESLQIDFAFDDADVIEEGSLTAVIGRRKLEGDDSIIQEKSILKAAGRVAFITDEKQYGRDRDGSIPVLISPVNWMETAELIDDLFLGDAEVWRRPTSGHAGPMGGDFPLVTEDGHHILDVIFTSPIHNLAEVAGSLNQIDGVVDHGVICGISCIAIIASEKGVMVVDNSSR
ncbi:putative ribose-5-phosphate isomerase [Dioscorea sansibarensis]